MTKAELIDKVAQQISKTTDVTKKATGEIIDLAVKGDAGTRVRWGDLYRTDLSEFDVVYVWGTAYSVGTDAFAAFAARSLRPGARLVSYHTPIPGWEPVDVDKAGMRPIYIYCWPGSSG